MAGSIWRWVSPTSLNCFVSVLNTLNVSGWRSEYDSTKTHGVAARVPVEIWLTVAGRKASMLSCSAFMRASNQLVETASDR